MIVVSDATPINALVQIGDIDVLHHLFGEVIIPPTVASELSAARTPAIVRQWLARPPGWLKIRASAFVDPSIAPDLGEQEAICLGIELHADLLLVDDRGARAAARRAGMRLIGTVGGIGACCFRWFAFATGCDRLSPPYGFSDHPRNHRRRPRPRCPAAGGVAVA